MISVLIVDDSQVVRQHLRYILESDRNIRVVRMARDGEEAVRFVQEHRPDIITMDINMPKMNGLEATRRIMETNPVPIVIVSASFSRNDVQKSFLAMEAGAIAIAEKPLGEGHPNYNDVAKELVQTVKLMSEVRVIKRWPKAQPSLAVSSAGYEAVPRPKPQKVNLVAIGASTGGPPVIQTILSGLHKEFPIPVMAVQHIASGFLEGMIEWLRHTTELPISVAAHGEHLLPGHVYFAPDDLQMGIKSGGRITLSNAEHENGVRPSASYLFRSAMEVYGGNMTGVLLTGMGKDGAEELSLMKEKGAVTIVQDRESSVVYGMPGEAVRLGGATYVLSPEKIPSALESLVRAK